MRSAGQRLTYFTELVVDHLCVNSGGMVPGWQVVAEQLVRDYNPINPIVAEKIAACCCSLERVCGCWLRLSL
jgi:hypothetical protein